MRGFDGTQLAKLPVFSIAVRGTKDPSGDRGGEEIEGAFGDEVVGDPAAESLG
jgi:hypothetical protein